MAAAEVTGKRISSKPPANKVGGIDGILATHARDLDPRVHAVLRVRLVSIAPAVRHYAAGLLLEKDRKRNVDKVRTNALRLQTAIDELDEDSFEYVAYCMTGGDASEPRNTRRRLSELKARNPLRDAVAHLERIAAIQSKALPAQEIKVRPEQWIAGEVVNALTYAGLPATASDTGIAADCFRAIAEEAGIDVSESPRYWIQKAKDNPEI